VPVGYNTKYCSSCAKKKLFLIGKRHSPERIEKRTLALREWAKTQVGIAHYEKLGKSNSDSLKKHFLTARGKNQIKRVAKIQSKIIKERIKSGKWTPNIHNRWTRWDAKITIDGVTKKFRSSWEACFWFCNQSFKYEKIRIPNKDSVVITDFVDESRKIIYEIKPKALYRKEKNKINAIIKWCQSNGYLFIWLNEYNIMKYIDKQKFIGNVNEPQLIKMLKGIK
jgi:aspartate 1-decarboxylase